MKCIADNCKLVQDDQVLSSAEKKFAIHIKDDVKSFFNANSGGYPVKGVVSFHGEEYEVRVFLSLDCNDEHYFIEKPLNYFLSRTKGKIIPIALDSGDNYYCVNNETGKVYFWHADENLYTPICDSLEAFVRSF